MGGLGYGFHGHGREEECQHSADEKSYNDMRVKDVNGGELYCLSIGNKQGQSCKGSRTDGKTFADGSGCIANRVQLVSYIPDVFVQTGHFGDSACIVSDGTVSVNGYGDSGGGQHAYGCQGNSVKPHKFVGNQNAHTYQQDGNCG